MKKVARFEKVSFEQFKQDWLDCFPNTSLIEVEKLYDAIRLPKRATKGSAGYDFYTPISIHLLPKESIKIPTGIRAYINDGWVLQLFPRSSLGFKYRLQMNNTVGIIDSDYYDSDNEGHIFIKMTNDTVEDKEVEIPVLHGIAQGIFLPFGICEDDDATEKRNGGFGSTN